MKPTRFLAATLLSLALAPAAQAAVLYSNDFETGSTAGFAPGATIITAPNAAVDEQFLGPLSVGAGVTLTLDGFAAGQTGFGLAFDLYALNSLDGDGLHCCGPDRFTLVVNGTTIFDETFAIIPGWQQSFGGPGVPGGTGSDPALTGRLGYSYWGPDQTYHLAFTGLSADAAGKLVIGFFGMTDQGWSDEGFGVDNVVVTGSPAMPPVPLPAGLSLLGAALAGLGLMARRRRG